tara:strand:- start:1394 stop:1630 length:237 start_codon:yes stop_codon:yes gene_type:complete
MNEDIEYERYIRESKPAEADPTGWCVETQTMLVREDECAYCGSYYNPYTGSQVHEQMCKDCKNCKVGHTIMKVKVVNE